MADPPVPPIDAVGARARSPLCEGLPRCRRYVRCRTEVRSSIAYILSPSTWQRREPLNVRTESQGDAQG